MWFLTYIVNFSGDPDEGPSVEMLSVSPKANPGWFTVNS